MVQNRANQTITRWSVVFHRKRRVLETGKIQQMVREGLISNDAAAIRLANLGWTDADRLLWGAETAQRIVYDQQKLATSTQRQLVSVAKQRAAELTRAQRELAKMQPPAKLIKLYDKGDITIRYLKDTLQAEGWTAVGIKTLIETTRPDRHLTKADWVAMWNGDVIDKAEFTLRLEELGYGPTEIADEIALIERARSVKAQTAAQKAQAALEKQLLAAGT
jgi:adenine-specific DNA methylase